MNDKERDLTSNTGTRGALFSVGLGSVFGYAGYRALRRYFGVSLYSAPVRMRLAYAGCSAAAFLLGLEVGLAQMKGIMVSSLSQSREPLGDVLVDILMKHPEKAYYESVIPNLASYQQPENLDKLMNHKAIVREKRYV